MINDVLQWYHITLSHPGITSMEQTIGKLFYVPNLKASVTAHVNRCDACQRHKGNQQREGEVALREDNCYPFEEVGVDLIGPWKINVADVGEVEFNALTMIDTSTVLTELTRIANKTSHHVTMKFENEWLA